MKKINKLNNLIEGKHYKTFVKEIDRETKPMSRSARNLVEQACKLLQELVDDPNPPFVADSKSEVLARNSLENLKKIASNIKEIKEKRCKK